MGFGDDNDAWDNSNIPASSAPRPAIFGLWDDLNPVNDNCNSYCSGNVYTHGNSERFVVWFNEVAHCWTNFEDSYYDFQIVLYSNGNIDVNRNWIKNGSRNGDKNVNRTMNRNMNSKWEYGWE